MTRTFKPIRNKHVRNMLTEYCKGMNLDGELVAGGSLYDTTSAIMSEYGQPDFVYHVFDELSYPSLPYTDRLDRLVMLDRPPFVHLLPQIYVRDTAHFFDFEQEIVESGAEGVMIRSTSAPYKCGRSTFNEQILIKCKRSKTEEAKIVGFVQRVHNTNEQERDAFGLAKRSHKQEGMELVDQLGALQVMDKTGRFFEVGSGFTLEQRTFIWNNMVRLLGKTIMFKHYPQGAKDLPRNPIFIAFREEDEL